METLLGWWREVATYMQQGGFVMWPLAVGAAALWYGLGYRMLMLRRGSRASLHTLLERAQSGALRPNGQIDGAMQRAVAVVESGTHELRRRLDDALAPTEAELDRYSLVVKCVVIIAPLAGLLGTVSGMIETFDSLGDMILFRQSGGIAGGISQALISTQMGLAVAIPGLLVGQMLWRRQESLLLELEAIKVLLCARFAPQSQEAQGEAAMPFARRKKSSEAQVDISPLIDMVFILLIFFMVSTTFVKDLKIELERPAASSATRASTKALRVHLDRAGAIYMEGSPVKAWMLQSRIRQLLKDDPSKPVLVVTDRLVQAEKLIEVIDQCRLAGAKDVGVATRKEAG